MSTTNNNFLIASIDILTSVCHTASKMLPIETDIDRARSLEARLRAYAAVVALDPESPIPLHYQLFRVLRQFTQKYHLTTDDRLPPEELVARVFGVSRPTATRAIHGFVDQQQLTRTPGRGSFFRSKQRLDLTLLADSLSVLDAVHPPSRLTTEVVTQTLTGSVPMEVQDLGIPSDSVVVFLRRLRSIDGQPVMVCDSYLPAELFPELQNEELVKGSLYATLASAYGARIVRSNRFIQVTEIVDRDIIQLLGVPVLSPVFVLVGLSYDESDRLCEVIVSHIVGEARFSSTVGDRLEPMIGDASGHPLSEGER